MTATRSSPDAYGGSRNRVVIEVAFDERELLNKLDHLEAFGETEPISARASQDLIASIRTFIETGYVHVESVSA